MTLSAEVRALILRFAERVPVPRGVPGETFEEQARQWSTRLAEQLLFSRPAEGWGKKRADPGRPVSKDAIARSIDGRLWSWDILIGTGTGAPTLNLGAESEDITGQVFVPVSPVDYLDGHPVPAPAPLPAPPPPPPRDKPPDVRLFAATLAELASLRASVDAMRLEIEALKAAVASQTVDFPTYVGTITIPFFRLRTTIELTPQGPR